MDISDKFKKLWYHPSSFWIGLGMLGLLNWVPDEIYLKIAYRLEMKKKLNLANPQTFNEKLQWLKLHDRKPEYTQMVDKYAVREYIAKTIGEEYLIPLLGVWNAFDEIDFDQLPDQFVLKCNHDSGSVVICKDKKTFDVDAARKNINAGLAHNYYYGGREWPYKNVKPKIIAEKYMVDESGTELKDYKLFCFNGEVKIVEIDFDRFIKHTRNLYTSKWEFLNFQLLYPNDSSKYKDKPIALDDMIKMASYLSKNIPHLRVDFYQINNKIYFGELTFFHEAGFGLFSPNEWDKILGDWIKLPK